MEQLEIVYKLYTIYSKKVYKFINEKLKILAQNNF